MAEPKQPILDLVEEKKESSVDSEEPDSIDEQSEEQLSHRFDLQVARQKLNESIDQINLEKQNKIRKSTPDYSNNFYRELRIDSLCSFYYRAQAEYKDFRNFFKLDVTNEDL